MPATVVIGGQWGDEGKGRVVDLLARDVNVIARYSAGNNAGHTIINSQGLFALHIVPAGIFYPEKTCIIGNGMAVDPSVLLEEIDTLEGRGVPTDKLFVSDRAHVVMPYHPLIDQLDEKLRGAAAVGTTGRGIGPCFADKVGRLGIRMGDLVDPQAFRDRLEFVLPYKNAILTKLYDSEPLAFNEVYERYGELAARLAPRVCDTSVIARNALSRGETILLEGAQGALLDLDGGTYDYVTSSVPSSTAAGAAIGMGVGPADITKVVGVYKAYMTRVGNGPMPTELLDETGQILRMQGPRPEVGTTTGRPRRTGWFDAVVSRYSAHVNSVTGIALTRLDVLDPFPSILVCTGYKIDGKHVDTPPASITAFDRAVPEYEELPGWQSDSSSARRFEDLPENAQRYVRRIGELIGKPIEIVSVGPEREQVIIVDKPL
ncbi:MAG TPA: adenylosuccinate synthase [Dehalococcoidia bacterium]|jgi:adenylosuccinate synthase|nr:adenylosuccinate synthase [Dehalococcoidia bacterium]